ncbi:MAG: hypothetical protein KF690_00675 [Bacteroidetes bacterium]|nr:hypothetical protein [Bacteroidota bacterium]
MYKLAWIYLLLSACTQALAQNINSPLGVWYNLQPRNDGGILRSGSHCFDCLLPNHRLYLDNPSAWYLDLMNRIQRRAKQGNYITEEEKQQLAFYGFTETGSLHRLFIEVGHWDVMAEIQRREQAGKPRPMLQTQTAQQMVAERTYKPLSQSQQMAKIMAEAEDMARQIKEQYELINEVLRETKDEQVRQKLIQDINAATRWYYDAFAEMRAMIEEDKPDLLRAVWLSEAAYWDSPYYMEYEEFKAAIQAEAERVRKYIKGKNLSPYELHMAIFYTLWEGSDGQVSLTYDFFDPMGEKDMSKGDVNKLLKTRTGQCHSLPLLYKLVANELGAECWMSYIPNHSLVQIKDSIGYRRVYLELTNHRVLTDKNLLETGYVPVEGLHSGIYGRAVDDREVIAECLADLLVVNARKLGDYVFEEKCADYILSQYPRHLRGMMFKAGALTFRLRQAAAKYKYPPPNELSKYPEPYKIYLEREAVANRMEELGYAPYSKQAYAEWTNTLKKYQSLSRND